MKRNITVTVKGEKISAKAGMTLSEILRGEKPCGGHGRCGKCKVIAVGRLSAPDNTERRLLSEDELRQGVRLACRAYAWGDCAVEMLTHAETEGIVTEGWMPSFEKKPSFSRYGIAMDLGTTTLAARLYDAKGGMLAETARLNPQGEWGADVITRIEAALAGKAERLASAIRIAVDKMCVALASMARINPTEIDQVVITGNTVMLSLLTETCVEPFSCAPFDVKRLFGEVLSAKALGLSDLAPDTPVHLPPCISAFVGADTVCAILATELCAGETAMLADIGTNGEIALWHQGKLTVCSTAAGPSFEGVGISMGMRGAAGAIDRVRVLRGFLEVHVIGNTAPVGICGSGLIDAAACMLELGALDESGYLKENPFVLCAPVSLTQEDIRMLQLAKSAIGAGMLTLMQARGISPASVVCMELAGGFGNCLDPIGAARIGLLPSDLTRRTRSVGNAALAGASMLLLRAELWENAARIAKDAEVLELATDASFAEAYVRGMTLKPME